MPGNCLAPTRPRLKVSTHGRKKCLGKTVSDIILLRHNADELPRAQVLSLKWTVFRVGEATVSLPWNRNISKAHVWDPLCELLLLFFYTHPVELTFATETTVTLLAWLWQKQTSEADWGVRLAWQPAQCNVTQLRGETWKQKHFTQHPKLLLKAAVTILVYFFFKRENRNHLCSRFFTSLRRSYQLIAFNSSAQLVPSPGVRPDHRYGRGSSSTCPTSSTCCWPAVELLQANCCPLWIPLLRRLNKCWSVLRVQRGRRGRRRSLDFVFQILILKKVIRTLTHSFLVG